MARGVRCWCPQCHRMMMSLFHMTAPESVSFSITLTLTQVTCAHQRGQRNIKTSTSKAGFNLSEAIIVRRCNCAIKHWQTLLLPRHRESLLQLFSIRRRHFPVQLVSQPPDPTGAQRCSPHWSPRYRDCGLARHFGSHGSPPPRHLVGEGDDACLIRPRL